MLSLLDKTEEYTFPNLSTTDVVMNTVVAPKVYRTRKASYNDCREAIKDFKFKSMAEYQTWLDTSNCSDIFYKCPAQSYANNGWVSTRDFLSMTEEEYRQLKSERGRWVGTTHSSKPRKKSAPKATKIETKVETKVADKNEPTFTEVIYSLCKQGVPDHIVKVVFNSYNPTFQDLKDLCQELIILRK